MIKILNIEPLENPQFVKPKKLIFEKEGIVKSWELVDTHDSVSVLLYHKERDAFVLVKQFRPAIYLKNGDGMTVELCAGLVDKEKSLKQIVKEEIVEECGYDVPLECIEKITSFYTAVGFAGGQQTLYFAQINSSMQVNEGGGLAEEDIEVIYIPVIEAKDF
nr:NUDIX domain-containing protein [Campylobacterota bacterium]